MSRPEHTPDSIEPTEDGTALRIIWQDGHTSELRPRPLRMSCPCAGCVDEMTGTRILTEEMVPTEVYPQSIHYVGRYALQFHWSDGHSTGIYPYTYLRRICPCAQCAWDREENGEGAAE